MCRLARQWVTMPRSLTFKEMIGLSFSELDWLLLIFAFIGAFSLMVFGQSMAAVIIIILMLGAVAIDQTQTPHHPRRPAM